MLAEFISPDDIRWKKLLTKTNHDSYHLPEYITFAARHEGGRPCAFLAETGDKALLVPLLMRSLPKNLQQKPGFCDVLTPYGYPGPILAGNPSRKIVAEMLQAFLREGQKTGIVSAYWRLHPLLSFPLGQLDKLGTLVHHGPTVYIDLSHTQEQLWQETSNNHQRGIKKLQKKGFVAIRNDWCYWGDFIETYRETMRRVNACNFYFFSDAYFNDIRTFFGDRLEFWTALSPEGKVAAAALFIIENGIVQYHLGAVVDQFIEWSPIKLIISEVRTRAKEAGHRVLHLGGGLGGRTDSLYDFKYRFSHSVAAFHTFRAILMPALYADLVMQAGNAKAELFNAEADFFPAYRNRT